MDRIMDRRLRAGKRGVAADGVPAAGAAGQAAACGRRGVWQGKTPINEKTY